MLRLGIGQFHNLSVDIQMRQLWPRVLSQTVNEPPRNGKYDNADQDHAVVIHG